MIYKSEYDLVRRAAILADNPNHANVEDVRLMAQRILDMEKTAAAQKNAAVQIAQAVHARPMYSKG